MDWQVFATIAAPIFALLLGAALNRTIERRPKLVIFMSHASAVRMDPPQGQPFSMNSHAIVVRNTGRLPAKNVRLGHLYLPEAFSVWPLVEHAVNRRQDGSAEIVFPNLVPGEQVTVTYIYASPVTFNQINSYTKSDEGMAHIVTALTQPPQPRWIRIAITAFATYGASLAVYQLGLFAQRAFGA